MYDEQTRINATISYLFLGPIFLLARKGTPLAEKYVQDHAKRASLLILVSFGVYLAYYFARDFLSISLVGISLSSVILAILVTIILAILLHGAYFAYSGREANSLKLGDMFTGKTGESHLLDNENTDASTYSDEEKIRIVASFFPFVGIWLSSRYDRIEIQTGRRIASFMVAIIILTAFVSWGVGLGVLFAIIYIGLIVITLVGLFVQKQFFSLGIYHSIPTYLEFEAHLFACVRYSWSFVRVIFGGEKKANYQEVYSEILVQKTSSSSQWGNNGDWSVPYFMPLWLVGLPVFNLITLPSLFNSTYARYRDIVLQGITLTILFVLIGMTAGWNSSLETILLFPMIHLMSFASKDPDTRAPIVSLGVSLLHFISASKETINETAQKNEEKVSFSYNSTSETKETREKITNL
jgi:hypothetical protein